MHNLPKNFFEQPAFGFTETEKGLTVDELHKYEEVVGYTLPQEFKTLYAIQNGGTTYYEQIGDGKNEVKSLYGGFARIKQQNGIPVVTTFRDMILACNDETEIKLTKRSLPYFFPERLIHFAPLDGHSGGYLDYGYLQSEELPEPRVVFIEDDPIVKTNSSDEEYLFFKELTPAYPTFADFLRKLQPQTSDVIEYFVGIESTYSYPELIEFLHNTWGTKFTEETDDRNGNFNFDIWHTGFVPLTLDDKTIALYATENNSTLEKMITWVESEGRTRNIQSVFSPNKYLADTCKYPDNPELTTIIEIHRPWFDPDIPINTFVAELKKLPGISNVLRLPS
jgi:SMI1 / KNR4 family (SUKH-1)